MSALGANGDATMGGFRGVWLMFGGVMDNEALNRNEVVFLYRQNCYCSTVSPVPSAGRNRQHLEDIHMNLAQLKKKRDKKATLQEFDGALDLQFVETTSRFPMTSSKLEGDDATIIYDDVTIADLKKPMEDSAGSYSIPCRFTLGMIVLVFDSQVILDEESLEAIRNFTWMILG
nr:hypothetical protein [Tanacetum cinerariifolium]